MSTCKILGDMAEQRKRYGRTDGRTNGRTDIHKTRRGRHIKMARNNKILMILVNIIEQI